MKFRPRRPRLPHAPFLILIFLLEIPIGAICAIVRSDLCADETAHPVPVEVKIPKTAGGDGDM